MNDEWMTDYPENPGPLPALKLQNSGESEEARGALGNEAADKMYYTGGDRAELVRTLQKMLRDLLYDIGNYGPDGDGVDGIFGKKTEDAVERFQEENKDWDSGPLKVDGLVGPRTSDALNRRMVGKWYDHYQTPVELVEGMPYHAVTRDVLNVGLSIESSGTQKGRIFLIGQVSETDKLRIRLHDGFNEPMTNVEYRINIGNKQFKGITEDGWVSVRAPPDDCIECEVEWGKPDSNGKYPYMTTLALNCNKDQGNEKEQAIARLHNIGYSMDNNYEDNVRLFQQDYSITGEYGLLPGERLPPNTKKELWDIYGIRKCDASRSRKEQPAHPSD